MKLQRIFLFSMVCLILVSCASASLFVVNTLARFDDYSVYQDIPYGDHALNQLDIYVPAKLSNNTIAHPVVIFFYGGCWGGCNTRNKEAYVFVAQALTKQGYIVVLPDYRRHPEVKFDAIINDASDAVEWIKRHIESYGGNDNTLFLMGHSSGAHMASMLTLNEDLLQNDTYKSLKGFIGLAGPYDFLPFTKPYQFTVFGPEHKHVASQPINFVDGTEPPLLLLYGKEDTVVYPQNIKNLAQKVSKKAGQVTVHLYKNVDHYSILAALSIPYQKKQAVLDDIVQFLGNNSDDIMVNKMKK